MLQVNASVHSPPIAKAEEIKEADRRIKKSVPREPHGNFGPYRLIKLDEVNSAMFAPYKERKEAEKSLSLIIKKYIAYE